MILWHLFGQLLLAISYSTEIITLENKKHFICVTDYINYGIYNEPITVEKHKITTIFMEENNNIWNDWMLLDSKDIILEAPIVDRRWEGFETIYRDNIGFVNKSSISFSIYSPEEIEFLVNDDSFYNIIRNSSSTWIHYTISVKKNDVYLFENGHLVKEINKLRPKHIFLKTPTKKFWKLHDYKVRVAYNESKIPTEITIKSSDVSCLALYVFMCPNCFMDVTLPNNSIYHFLPSQHWKTKKILLESESTIHLFKYSNSSSSKKFWVLDIRQCSPTENGKEIYKVLKEVDEYEMNRKCKTLNDNIKEKCKIKRSVDNDFFFSCAIGVLGLNCDIYCEDLLGSEKKYCEEYKICKESSGDLKCLCSWGYQGPFCERECEDGKWGFSCKQICPENCINCHKKTGRCENTTFNDTSTALSPKEAWMMVKVLWIGGIILVVLTALVLASVICFFKLCIKDERFIRELEMQYLEEQNLKNNKH